MDNQNDDGLSPGQIWTLYQRMIEFHHKLLVINYSSEFRSKFKSPPVHPLQLAVQNDWFVFAQLYSFLTQKDIDVHMTSKKEILNLVENDLKQLNNDELLAKVKDDKLDKKDLIEILHVFVDEKIHSLENVEKITLKGNEIDNEEEEEEEEENEMEEIDYTIVMEDEDNRFMTDEISDKKMILKSQLDEKEWKIEVERVLPQLKTTYDREEKNDWRSHLNQFHQLRKSLEVDSTWSLLKRWKDDINNSNDKIVNREKYLWSQLENVCLEWASVRTKLDKIKEEFSKSSVGVTTKSAQLQAISDSIDELRNELEAAGTSLNDQSSLTEIKKTMNTINSELSAMNLEIGVALVNLLKSKAY